ncbi:MAG TPA: TRAP transporter substrate-binding protein [Alphaproteobacteria bacterium]|nr:TRAP transporter substrate-binding protein [Alphaproteobacteria bacterium]
MKRLLCTFASIAALMLAMSTAQAAAQTIELKVSLFAAPTNPLNVEFTRVASEIMAKSGGRLKLDLFHDSQLGPPPRQFDLVRAGVADMAYVLDGLTPGRFPLSELVELPGVSPSGFASSMALRDLLDQYLAKEYAGTRVLGFMVTPPVPIFTTKVPIHSIDDLKGLRIRHPGPVISATLQAFGATPMSVQPGDVHEALGRGVIDGAAIGYSGATSFKLEDVVKYVTDPNIGGVAFTVVMNPAAYDRLPPDLKQLIDSYATLDASRTGWATVLDRGEAEQREILLKQGIQPIQLTDTERASFAAAAAKVQDATLAALEAKGLPARAYFTSLKAALKKYGG